MRQAIRRGTILLLLSCALLSSVILLYAFYRTPPTGQTIDRWQYKWAEPGEEPTEAELAGETGGWLTAGSRSNVAAGGNTGAIWIRVELPEGGEGESGLYIRTLYGHRITAYDQHLDVLYESSRNHGFDVNRVLLPVRDNTALLIKAESASGRIGIEGDMTFGNYSQLLRAYTAEDMDDLIFGGAFLLASAIMLFCASLLPSGQLRRWLSLSVIMLALGLMALTYSPILYTLHGHCGYLYRMIFDLAVYTLLPAFTYFFEHAFETGGSSFLEKFRKFQIGYSFLCLVLTILNYSLDNKLHPIQYPITVTFLGAVIAFQLLVLVGFCVRHAVRRERNAILFACGFAWLASLSLGELVWYYATSADYPLGLWKWGVIGFVLSLTVILGRRLACDHHRLVQYSRELEKFNRYLQKHEKLEIVSELTASVAHEVRNPLQVTRGFLQLLGKRTDSRERMYVEMALAELDRAAGIVSDFLAFARPELEDWRILKLSDELLRLESMLAPMAQLQGAKLCVDAPPDLYIGGHSAKLKQALINIVKNSIEALKERGEIRIWAYRREGDVYVHIKDNGTGMSPEELARLGEPYFSNKTKGTGLGLMVAFRIVEAMQGHIEYRSEKGVGTEAILRFPAVEAEEDREAEAAG
ncbi:ATP-binding protein [Paenibacillus thermoaerophilus]|uniref:histidine kinase n=1 Tax=Paenibacillus thermoaerophilus TaxID=1215385 RepID=A0ABW2V5I3_9BACL|nr:HAMP domain-containing sensor histidine kinase [Paenibacillus thermoaerophilus]TMV13918.1 HAMP domain-containing histidine kinase [Paenibacillus thermoaerophilus]